MDGQDETRAGREAVRELLIKPLADAGLKRPGRMKADDHSAALEKLVERLAYMSPQNLATLAEVVLDNAPGERDLIWPSCGVIWKWARALQQPPENERAIMSSWLRSVEGPIAREGGYLVELYLWLRQHGRPPLDYDMRMIREKAAENAHARELIADRTRRGVASADDGKWLDWYGRMERRCLDLVEAGDRHRSGEGTAA